MPGSPPTRDEQLMSEALELARKGVALASPNPCVGAVLVDGKGKVIGRGSHTYEGRKHAEVLALEAAGDRARGSTLYVNLEPCSHVGRTGPCADALITAGVKRVLVSMRDPNPAVSGRGLARVRDAGIEVREGLGEAQPMKLNESFAKYLRQKTPFVTLKTAMTLDGKIAPPQGEEVTPGSLTASGGWITSEEARAHVHELRHANDAIMVGMAQLVYMPPCF